MAPVRHTVLTSQVCKLIYVGTCLTRTAGFQHVRVRWPRRQHRAQLKLNLLSFQEFMQVINLNLLEKIGRALTEASQRAARAVSGPLRSDAASRKVSALLRKASLEQGQGPVSRRAAPTIA